MTIQPTATATYYAACGPQNQVSLSPSGTTLELFSNTPDYADISTDSAYDCCVACLLSPNCYGSNWGAGFKPTCELELGTNCPAGQAGSAGTFGPGTSTLGGLTFSNGLCGAFTYDNTL